MCLKIILLCYTILINILNHHLFTWVTPPRIFFIGTDDFVLVQDSSMNLIVYIYVQLSESKLPVI